MVRLVEERILLSLNLLFEVFDDGNTEENRNSDENTDQNGSPTESAGDIQSSKTNEELLVRRRRRRFSPHFGAVPNFPGNLFVKPSNDYVPKVDGSGDQPIFAAVEENNSTKLDTHFRKIGPWNRPASVSSVQRPSSSRLIPIISIPEASGSREELPIAGQTQPGKTEKNVGEGFVVWPKTVGTSPTIMVSTALPWTMYPPTNTEVTLPPPEENGRSINVEVTMFRIRRPILKIEISRL